MAQTSIASYFNARKRAAADDNSATKSKVFIASSEPQNILNHDFDRKFVFKNIHHGNAVSELEEVSKDGEKSHFLQINVNPIKGSPARSKKSENDTDDPQLKQQKLIKFTRSGTLSLYKNKITPAVKADAFTKKESLSNIDLCIQTPVKPVPKFISKKEEIDNFVKKLNFDEVKTKATRSAKLHELKASLVRLQEFEKARKKQEERNGRLRKGELADPPALTLKEFTTIELEVLSSPSKGLKTPTKNVPPAPAKNDLMSPKSTATSTRILLSPIKDGLPAKMIIPPAFQHFQTLAEKGTPSLQLPYKYRCLMEIFKCLDSVCAMFYNRKEAITFKKLKPAVQRMLRKNFNEHHLAQIKSLYPDAFYFAQMKTRNFGSISKQDYFQLVITPNVEPHNKRITEIDKDNVLEIAQSNAMNPQVIIDRQQHFHRKLLEKVKDEHEKFLKSLDPAIVINKQLVTRWHPEFNLEKCPDIEKAVLPQPPNVEKYSSAKDILSTARNLFNCTTPMERAITRYENSEAEDMAIPFETAKKQEHVANSILKNVPQSLLTKIRTKQAAKALDAITRRPSLDLEINRYSRLPEMARHLRNVFVTEKKTVLQLELVVEKISNSFRTKMSSKDIEEHLRLLGKECQDWLSFQEIRKLFFVKLNKEIHLCEIIKKLENIVSCKSK